MPSVILFNKPYDVLCQFTDQQGRSTLADFVSIKDVYPAGRLDRDSEGLLVLTADGKLQNRISDPRNKMEKAYWVQVEGNITEDAIDSLRKGINLKDGLTRPARVRKIDKPATWPRNPPIRKRLHIPTSWIEITTSEGRNRQVRRMTAATGFPTLRLIRFRVGPWSLQDLQPGEYRQEKT